MEPLDKELHRIAVTTIVYRDDGKFLITRRSLEKKAFPGKWTVPGGGLTTDDYVGTPPTHRNGQWYNTLENTIRREVKEEVGIEIGKPEYLLDITFIRSDGVPVLILSYYAPFVRGEVTHDADTIDSAWVTAEEAKQYDLIDGIAEEIQMVDDILKKK
ncbi:MAG TPA: NUDIX hydrolase [Candidatus Paceibacterota bacterium]|nr:NUDIX hydrolase [Candidatus Paceibacterota bacterium]